MNKIDPLRNNFNETILTNVGRIIAERRQTSEVLLRDKSNTEQRSLVISNTGADLSAEYTDTADFNLPVDSAYTNPETATLTDEYLSSNDNPQRHPSTPVDRNENRHGNSNRGVDAVSNFQKYFTNNILNRKSEINRMNAGNGIAFFDTDQSNLAAGSNEFTKQNLVDRRLDDVQRTSLRPEENTAHLQQLPSLSNQNETARREDKMNLTSSKTFKRRPGHLSLGFFGSARNAHLTTNTDVTEQIERNSGVETIGEYSSIEDNTAQKGILRKNIYDSPLKTNTHLLNSNESSTVKLAGIDQHMEGLVQQPNTAQELLSDGAQFLNNTVKYINETESTTNIIEVQPSSVYKQFVNVNTNGNTMLINATEMISNTTDPSYLNLYTSSINGTEWTTEIFDLNQSSVDTGFLTDWNLSSIYINATEWNTTVTDHIINTSSENITRTGMSDIIHQKPTAYTQNNDTKTSSVADVEKLIVETQTSAPIPRLLDAPVSTEPSVVSVATASTKLAPLNASVNEGDYVYYNYYYDYPDLNATTDPPIGLTNNNSVTDIVGTDISSWSNTSIRNQYNYMENSSEENITVPEGSNTSIGHNLHDIFTERKSLDPLINFVDSKSVNSIVGSGIPSMSNTSVRIQYSHTDNSSAVNIAVPKESNISIGNNFIDIVTERRNQDTYHEHNNVHEGLNVSISVRQPIASQLNHLKQDQIENILPLNESMGLHLGVDTVLNSNHTSDVLPFELTLIPNSYTLSVDNLVTKNKILTSDTTTEVYQITSNTTYHTSNDKHINNLNNSITSTLVKQTHIKNKNTRSPTLQMTTPLPYPTTESLFNFGTLASTPRAILNAETTLVVVSDSVAFTRQTDNTLEADIAVDKNTTSTTNKIIPAQHDNTRYKHISTVASPMERNMNFFSENSFKVDSTVNKNTTFRPKDVSAVSSQTERNMDFFSDNSIKVDNAIDENTTSTTHRFTHAQPNNTRPKDMSTVSSPTERNMNFISDNSINIDKTVNKNNTLTTRRFIQAQPNNTRSKDMSTVSSSTERNMNFFSDNNIKVDNTFDANKTITTQRFTQPYNTRYTDLSTVSSPTERNLDFFFDNSTQIDNTADKNKISTAHRFSNEQPNNTRSKDMSTVSSTTENNLDFFFDNSINIDRFGGVPIENPYPDLSIYTNEPINENNTNSGVADWVGTSVNGMWKSLADGSFDITNTMTSDGNLWANTDSLRLNNSTPTDKIGSIDSHNIIMTMLKSNQTWPGDNSVHLLNSDVGNSHTAIHASSTISLEGEPNAADMLSADWKKQRNNWAHSKELLDYNPLVPFQSKTETVTASRINTNDGESRHPVLKTNYNELQAQSANVGKNLRKGTVDKSDIMMFNAPHVSNESIKTTKTVRLNSHYDSQLKRSMESLENNNMSLVSSRKQLISKAPERDSKVISLEGTVGGQPLHMNIENTVQNIIAPQTIRNTNKVESSSENIQSQSRQQVLKYQNRTNSAKITTGPLRENKEIIGISLNGNSNVNKISKSKDASLEISDFVRTPEHMPPISVRTDTTNIIQANGNAKIKTTNIITDADAKSLNTIVNHNQRKAKSENNEISYNSDTLKTQSNSFDSSEQVSKSGTRELNIKAKGTQWNKQTIQENKRGEPNDQISKTLEALVIELKAREKDDTVSPIASLLKPIHTTEKTDDLSLSSTRYRVWDNTLRPTNTLDDQITRSRNNFIPFDIREELNIDTLQPASTNPLIISRNKQATNNVNSSPTSNKSSTFGTTDALIPSASISSDNETNSSKVRQVDTDSSNVHTVKTISTNVQNNKKIPDVVLPKEVQLLSKLNSKRKNQLTENMITRNVDSKKYIEKPNDITKTIIDFNTRQNIKTDLNVFPSDLQTISGVQYNYKESSTVNHINRNAAERPSAISLASVRVKNSEGIQGHDQVPTFQTILDSSSQSVNHQDLISIEGKYFIGQMRRNALGQFEPVPLASDIINTSPLPYSTIVESTYSIVNPTMPSSGRVLDKRERFGTLTNKQTPLDTFDLPRDSTTSYAIFETITPTRDPTSDVKPRLFYSQEQLLKELIGPETRNGSKPVPKIFVSQDELLRSVKAGDLYNNVNTEFTEHGYLNDIINPLSNQAQMTNGEAESITGKQCPVDKVIVCKAIGINQYIPGMVLWCYSHCRYGVCPRDKCECTCEVVQFESSPLDKGKKPVQTKKIIELTLDGSKEKTVLVDKSTILAPNINISNVSKNFNERNAKKSNQRIENSTKLNVLHVEESQPLVKGVDLPNITIMPVRVNGRISDTYQDATSSITKYESQTRLPKSSSTITPTDILNVMYSKSSDTMASQSQYSENNNPPVINIIQNEKAKPTRVIQVNGVSTEKTLITNNEILAKVRSRDFTCVGINAFIGMDGINEWCTRLCKQDMCPLDICSCT
ncbi:hypothetical protein DPMN_037787 [Dreissena polymorpha]|uniref:Uncharacterized protein n=1 Tax=Dreissena polymorpha TaxID=45954 RepID=A0A9D4MFQ6_DREPO|nr:hypothetical protein DPMN_037787 [Dreissena polymorpha]